MTDRPPFKRNQEGARLYYDVLSSKGTFYYEVNMIGTVATSCDCKAGMHKQPCKHRKTAEKAELEFQDEQKRIATAEENTLHGKMLAAALNGDRSFNLLRR